MRPPVFIVARAWGYNASISVCEKSFEWQLPLHFLDLKGDMTDMMSPSAFFHLWNSMVKSFHQTLGKNQGKLAKSTIFGKENVFVLS